MSQMRIFTMLLLATICASPVAAQTVVRYVHTDSLGSVVALTDEAGNVVERREYEPYGAQLTPALADGPGYTGHVQDAATGLIYMQQRYYDPSISVFLSVDPVTAYERPLAGFSRYRYAANNPYKFSDPDGMCERTTGSRICGGGAGNNTSIIQVNPADGGSGWPNGNFNANNAQSRFNAADRAVRSVRGTVGEIKHSSEDAASRTFEHVFQPIASRFGVEIEAGIDGGRVGSGFYLVDIAVGHEFGGDGLGYTVRGGFGSEMPTIHTHPILSNGAKGYSPFSSNDLHWFGSSSAPMRYVSDPGGLYRFNGRGVIISSVPRLEE
ncbi:RHS repeat-associated core domain-containing protein [Luteimonas sp. TWI662]|uniref:RHS repeat domain-containing protein n=1 Tax=Luteimonas sp. TWI662 TaxID=3136789 RepID=UPI00320865F1